MFRFLSSAETCDGSCDTLFQPVFVMQTAQDVLRSGFAVTWQSVPCIFDRGRGLSMAVSGIPGPRLECGRPLL
jgi:hypothetical protein